MPSIKNLEMAAAVSANENISIKKSLFSTKVFYKPTQSPISIIVQEYTPIDGEHIVKLLNMPLDKMGKELEKGKPATTPVGHFRLEICLSEDRQFCALQLFRFPEFKYVPVTEPRFYEGSDVETIVKLIL